MGGGDHLSGGATGRAAAESQAASLVQQVQGQVAALNQLVASLTPHIAMLRGRNVRKQQCIDTAYFRLHHNLPLSAREILELELSQDRYPSSGMGWKKQRPPSYFTPLIFEQNYVSNKASKFQTPDFKPILTSSQGLRKFFASSSQVLGR